MVAYEEFGQVRALRIQSRAGLLSREGPTDVACFPYSGSNGPWDFLFERVAFVGNNEIEVVTTSLFPNERWLDQATRVRFDPETLEAESRPGLRCKG